MSASLWRKASVCWIMTVAAAVALRLFNLATWDMWTDEVHTLTISQSGRFLGGPLYITAPVNFFLTGLVLPLFESREVGVRLVPFIAGTLTVVLFYPLLGRRFGQRAGLLGTLALALSMWHVSWSQTGRHFALQTLLILIGLAGFLWFWESRRLRGLTLAALAFLLALLTHSSSGFFVAALLAFVVLEYAVRRFRSASAHGGVESRATVFALVGLMVPLLLYLPSYLAVGDYLLEHHTAWNPPFNIIGSLAFYLPPMVSVPAAAGAVFLAREQDDRWLLLALVSILPALLLVLASVFTIASGAYLLSSMLAIAALTGVALDRVLHMADDLGSKIAVGVLVGGLYVGQAYDLAHYYFVYNGLKPRWSEVTAHVREHRAAGERFFAAEGDVAQFYLGTGAAEWLPDVGSTVDQPTEASWYAVYVVSKPGLAPVGSRFLSLLETAELRGLYPLHYGAKDRSIALFYEAGRDDS